MSHDQDITNLDYIGIHDFNHHLHQTNNNNNNNGWPLGLHSFINYPNSNHQNHSRNHSNHSNHAYPHMARSLSTPSITSQSNSSDDLETQSSESFFPDKSITLGSLIGIQSRTQPHQTHAIMLQRADRARKKAGIISNVGGGGTAMSGTIRGDRTCCSLLVCGSGVDRHKQVGMSPSLAHLLDKERKSMALPSLVHLLERRNKVRPWIGPKRGTFIVDQGMVSGSSVFDNDRVLPPPKPSGTPLKLFLQRSSPNSYISGDWSAFIERGEAMSQHEHCPQEASLSHGKWLSLCFKKDCTRMAG